DDQDWPAYGFGVPYGMSGNVLFRRDDVLSEAGFPDPPETWQELSDMAREAQDPPNHYGMGFALSNVGDANMTTTMLHTFGGRVADDAGETCTLDSPETREFLEWISGTWEDGLWPPGTPIWDGGGDNEAYQSGNALFIGNPGSVYLYMRDNDPELLEATQYSAFPGGPVLRAAPANIQYRTIPSSSDFPDLAKDLLRDLADPEFMRGYYENAIYGPVLQDYAEFDLFDAANSPAHAGLLDLALNGTGAAWPDVDNEAFAEYQNNFRTPSMVQRVVVDGLTIDEAVVEAQDACQQIYDRH
ncbi:MAG: extracellular solute-binding protein, partial [Dehalococcoidia bacterium]